MASVENSPVTPVGNEPWGVQRNWGIVYTAECLILLHQFEVFQIFEKSFKHNPTIRMSLGCSWCHEG